MNQLTYLSRKISRNITIRLKLDRLLFQQNQIKLEKAKNDGQELIDIMPGINLPMVIHPDMYFCYGYAKYIFEPDSLDFIGDCLKPGQTVLDVGANVGYFSLFCANLVTPTGCVIAFEPSDFAFNLLNKNKQINQFTQLETHQLGLGERDEIVQFNSGEPGMEVYNSVGNIVHPQAIPEKFNKVDVRLVNGSEWLQKNQIDRIDLMKLDVEGGEYAVLKGMLDMFKAHKVSRLLIEITYEMSQEFNYHPSVIIEMLRECGYDWFKLNSYGRLNPLLGNDIESSGMFVAVSKSCS